jgi:hypothetical protein
MRQEQRYFSARSVFTLSLYAAGLATLAGCGDGKLPLYPVTGTVLVDSKPATGARVIFCPVEASSSPELQKERPYGLCGPDGKFTLTTFLQDDGVPLGEYKVLVQWVDPAAAYDERAAGGDRLHGRYMNLQNTPLTATITEETVELPPLDLKSR